MSTAQRITFVLVLILIAFAAVELTAMFKGDPIKIVNEDKLKNMDEKKESGEVAGPVKPQDREIKGIVTLKTNAGDIKIQLFPGEAPKTVSNFIKLASDGFYDGTKFHRVIKDFMIQGGDPLSKDDTKKSSWGTGGPGYAFPDEFSDKLSNVPGTISMANSGPDTNGSQFFINVADNSFLDGKHSVFGQVTEGEDVVMGISSVETGPNDVPSTAIVIQSIVIE